MPVQYMVTNDPPDKVNHVLHLLLTIFTFGLWLPFWIVISALAQNRSDQQRVTTVYGAPPPPGYGAPAPPAYGTPVPPPHVPTLTWPPPAAPPPGQISGPTRPASGESFMAKLAKLPKPVLCSLISVPVTFVLGIAVQSAVVALGLPMLGLVAAIVFWGIHELRPPDQETGEPGPETDLSPPR
ncbi:hypothetical protein [Pseudonocardia eucalypti]|uniref:hypothetical protein n=1 Tax=Pseudonocardia eucalypti TaxID=648755 RepID=UPI0031E73D7D